MDKCFARAAKLSGGSWLPYRVHGAWLKERGRRSNAVKAVEAGFDRLGRPKSLLPEVLLLVHDVDTKARDAYLRECATTGPALRQACFDSGHATERKRRSEAEGKRIADKLTNKLFK